MEITNALLDNGANLEASDIGGRTPLYLAVKMENKMIINVILSLFRYYFVNFDNIIIGFVG